MINMSKEATRMPMQDPVVRKQNFDEVALGFTEEMAIREAMRCLRCRKHPCQTDGCPVHNNIPEFIAKITEGEFEAAYQVLTATTSLPAVCGRVCPQYLQCEGNCVRGKNGRPVAIGALERFVADYHRKNAVNDIEKENTDNGKKVAVIGSGPAGIACAGDLLDLGYHVTIFEKEDMLGGVLAYGIPEFRLPKDILEKEIDTLYKKGAEVSLNKALGKDFTIEGLMESEGYAAVFLANGAGKPMRLQIPGQDNDGVVSAADFLEKINIRKQFPEAKDILIVGGGNVAMDACRCAVRIPGARNVTIVYRRSAAEMPADPSELKEAMDEGVNVMYLTAPKEVISENGKATALKCEKMELSEPDESGRRKPVAVPGSEFVIPCDLIVEAIGNGSDGAYGPLLDADQRGFVVADPETQKTSRPGVFAGGDIATGPKTVISAMGAGKRAAKSINEYIMTHFT
ncbi:MAG: NAD(P)-dependent oxidoreductase [Lachnospiraceae bacterium]|nr:NAD(P)-dependent oxidoreductase [Lachnospiraceae bacterium]